MSLCVIVGKDESKELERCLKSVQGPLFDEIVVTLTQDDPEVARIAKKYADKTPKFKWVSDFSAARNACFDHATGDYIMWLDSDDEVTAENYNKLLELKPTLKRYDYVYITYNYAHNDEGHPSVTLPRERIVKNSPDLRWHDPIHEHILTHVNMKRLERVDIAVDHRRDRKYDASRNLDILSKRYESGEASPRIKFYYAKDLYDDDQQDKAAVIFDEYLNGPTDFNQNKVLACLKMYDYHLKKKDEPTYLAYLRKASMFSDDYAEVHYHLGTYYVSKGELREAAALFEKALLRKTEGLFGAKPDYYLRLPLDQLTKIYYDLKDYKKSLEYVERFLEFSPNSQNYHTNKKMLLKAIETGASPEHAKQAQAAEKKELKLSWLIRSFNPVDPSQRIRRLNVHNQLSEAGVKSALVTNYLGVDREWLLTSLKDSNVVISSAFDEAEYLLIKSLQDLGKKVIVDINEDILGDPQVQKILGTADGVVACSTALLEKAKPFTKRLAVIEDAVESVEVEHDPIASMSKGTLGEAKLVALFMGMGGNSFLVTDHLRDTIENAGYELKVCTEWDNADVAWDLNTWQETMASADVVLCPQRVDVQPAKSNIKAAQAMAFGIPVIASPLPSYKEFIVNGHNGYLCDGKEEWSKALTTLKDVRKRIQIGMNGQDSATTFSVENIANKWSDRASHILNSVATEPQVATPAAVVATKGTVPIVIPVYNGVEYLKACITSIHMNTLYPYHIILSDAGSNEETWEYLRTLKGMTILGSPGLRKNFSEAVNAGVSVTGEARFFTTLNSDVIVSKGWLTNLVHKMETTERLAVCGVLSNCDSNWLFNNPAKPELPTYNMKVNDSLTLKPGMTLDTVMPHWDDLNTFMDETNSKQDGNYTDQPWVAYYATIFAKSAWNDVGYLDPMYQSGCEDLDHCRRVQKLGYRIGQSLDSFVFHFGGISRGAYQDEDREQYDKEDNYNHDVFRQKWMKKEVVVYTGPAWEKWNREDVDKGMAGSETWAAELCAELSKAGHTVTLFGDPKTEGLDRDGVNYQHHSKMKSYVEYKYIDLCILSRTCEPPKSINLHTGNLYVMVHDVWLHQNKDYDTLKWAVKGFGVLSEWHDEFFKKHHNIPGDKTFLTFNGVRHSNYENVDVAAKKNKMVYSSSPDRGLDTLLKALPLIRKEVPDFEIDVAYGFHNWESMAKQRGDKVSLDRIAALKEQMEQPGVNYLGRINKEELAVRQKESKVWAFPTWFSETFCCLPTNGIHTRDGYKPFEDLTMKDEVLTHKNRYREIEQIMSREYKGEVLGLSIKGTKPVHSWFTPEHPVLSMTQEQVGRIRGRVRSTPKADDLKVRPEWRPVGDLCVRDYVCFPKSGECVENGKLDVLAELKKYHRGYKVYGGRVKQKNVDCLRGLPEYVDMNEDFARFLGLYLAEGSYSTSTVKFAFNVKEREYIDFVTGFLREVLGLPSEEKVIGGCLTVSVNSFPLGRLLANLFGSGPSNKRVPRLLLEAGDAIKKAFLRGVSEGDGWVQSKCEVKLELSSKKAIQDIRGMLFSLGVYPTYGEATHKGADGLFYVLEVSQSQWCKYMGLDPEHGEKESKTWFEHMGYVFFPIEEVKEKEYEGRVYNLEVREDNSYVSDFLAVHNCITGVENGLAGNAVVTTPYAGLLTTLGSSAIYIEGPEGVPLNRASSTQVYLDSFVKEVVRVLTDEEYRVSHADKVREQVKVFTWELAAKQWSNLAGL